MKQTPRWLLFAWLAVSCISGCKKKEELPYFQGYVEGEYVYIGSSQAGTLQSLLASRGQRVEVESPLFELDAEPQSLQLQEIRQRMEQAKSKLADASKGRRPSEISAIEAQPIASALSEMPGPALPVTAR